MSVNPYSVDPYLRSLASYAVAYEEMNRRIEGIEHEGIVSTRDAYLNAYAMGCDYLQDDNLRPPSKGMGTLEFYQHRMNVALAHAIARLGRCPECLTTHDPSAPCDSASVHSVNTSSEES